MNVVCIKWGDKYGPEYVNTLARAVAANLSSPHRFLCLTDDAAGVDAETVPLDEPLQGWWQKLTLFKERPYGLTGELLYLDLDVVVTGTLDGFTLPTDLAFCGWADPNPRRGVNTSVFSLQVGSAVHVWERFDPSVCRQMHGDQDWLNRQLPSAPRWPIGWVRSYKMECRREVPDGTRVVVFHGKPKPHECNGWVRGAWR